MATGRTRTHDDTDGKRTSRGHGLAAAAQQARAAFESITGMSVETMSGAVSDEQGWRLTLEVLELSRIPDSTSLLGTYEVVSTDEGELVEYSRLRRYYRNRADEE